MSMSFACRFSVALLLVASASAAPRQHTVFLGKWRTVKALADSGEARQVQVRSLIVDGRVKEYSTGSSHSVTEQLFVVRRAYRINDLLPEEAKQQPQWTWRLGGWISVDRSTGHVAQLNLPLFDAETSEASWYRDYAAYCGASEDGSKAYLVVSQLGKRKPLLRKEFTGPSCAAPKWERSPSRVSFTAGGEKNSFLVHARGAEPQPEASEEDNSR